MEILGRKHTEVTIKNKQYFPIELENILYRARLNGVWYQIRIQEEQLQITAEHRIRNEYPNLEKQIKTNFENIVKQKTEVKLIPNGSLYNYREIRHGKPLSRIVDEIKGKAEVVEGA